jgi:hypothetical protein
VSRGDDIDTIPSKAIAVPLAIVDRVMQGATFSRSTGVAAHDIHSDYFDANLLTPGRITMLRRLFRNALPSTEGRLVAIPHMEASVHLHESNQIRKKTRPLDPFSWNCMRWAFAKFSLRHRYGELTL